MLSLAGCLSSPNENPMTILYYSQTQQRLPTTSRNQGQESEGWTIFRPLPRCQGVGDLLITALPAAVTLV